MDFEQFTIDDLRARSGFKWRRYGPDVLPAWVADMDFPVAEPIRSHIVAAAERSDFGYPAKTEAERIPALFAERMQRKFGWTVPVERTVLLTDIVQGLYWAVIGTTEPGDGGPQRTVNRATRRGRTAVARWLDAPVDHVRDLRIEFLVKLRLNQRRERSPDALVAAQRAALRPTFDGCLPEG